MRSLYTHSSKHSEKLRHKSSPVDKAHEQHWTVDVEKGTRQSCHLTKITSPSIYRIGSPTLEDQKTLKPTDQNQGQHQSQRAYESTSHSRSRYCFRLDLSRIKSYFMRAYIWCFCFVVIANILAAVIVTTRVSVTSRTQAAGNEKASTLLPRSLAKYESQRRLASLAGSVNLTVAVLMRDRWVINAIFWLATRIPLTTSIRVRRIVAHVYAYGGVHSGCATFAGVWWTWSWIVRLKGIFELTFIRNYTQVKSINEHDYNGFVHYSLRKNYHQVTGTLTSLHAISLALIIGICITAVPQFRARYHNTFERVHRFGGWILLLLAWAMLVLESAVITRWRETDKFSDPYNTDTLRPTRLSDKLREINVLRNEPQHNGTAAQVMKNLILEPEFWCLLVTTVSVLHPWFHTRKWIVQRMEILGERYDTPLPLPPSPPLAAATATATAAPTTEQNGVAWTRKFREPHAIRLHFSGNVEACTSVRLALNPLVECHAFATIPCTKLDTIRGEETLSMRPDEKKYCRNLHKMDQFSVIVSSAGDWTRQIVRNPPRSLWMRGKPISGVLRLAVMFKPVVLLTTGSGIGPCLGLFNTKEWRDRSTNYKSSTLPGVTSSPFCRIVWAARHPKRTFGDTVLQVINRVDPQAVIIDTAYDEFYENYPISAKHTLQYHNQQKCSSNMIKLPTDKQPRVNLAMIAYDIAKEVKAEAIFCISNRSLTNSVLNQLRHTNMNFYSPIWDS